MNLRQALARATENLSGIEDLRPTAARDAELLLLDTLRLTRAQFLANPTRELTSAELSLYLEAIARRAHHEPVQYITGHQEFYGLRFRVTPAVLIPRPETEHLVEAVLERLPHDQPTSIADIGAGCHRQTSPRSTFPPRRSRSPARMPRRTRSPIASAFSNPTC
jgi:release factor glutamine methyltransferase